jgi:hypothetical protein
LIRSTWDKIEKQVFPADDNRCQQTRLNRETDQQAGTNQKTATSNCAEIVALVLCLLWCTDLLW